MKIALVKTYHCDKCGRYCYPDDIEMIWPDDQPNIWALRDHVRIVVTYVCACGWRMMRVPHEIDDNGELFPHYKLSGGK